MNTRLSNLLLISASFLCIHANADVAEKSFSLPGVIKVSYPGDFITLDAKEREVALAYSKRLFAKVPAAAFDQISILHTAYTQADGEYAHVNITLAPPELTQEDLAAAEEVVLARLTSVMIEKCKSIGIAVLGEGKGEREKLSDETLCFKLTFSYKKSDGAVRMDTKRYIYTNRHTVIIGITTSAGYVDKHKDKLDKIVESIEAPNN